VAKVNKVSYPNADFEVVDAEVVDGEFVRGKLVITVDLAGERVDSSTGKTELLVSTHGQTRLPILPSDWYVNVLVYRNKRTVKEQVAWRGGRAEN